MNKPEALQKGDKVAIVSLSWGGLGDDNLIHKYYIAKKRLEEDFGLVVVPMKHALMGTEFVKEHPELRAQDLMDAFKDSSIKAIICAIGGDDSVRLLPYIDYDVISSNPKIFMGYSDSTVTHFMLNKADVVSYYGPTIMCEFGEYVKMFDYTKEAVNNVLFTDTTNYEVKSSDYWCKDFIPWDEKNINMCKKLIPEEHHYEVLSGRGKITGQLIGGCVEVLPMLIDTEIWPSIDYWKGKILLLETSEEKISPEDLEKYLNLIGIKDILKKISGIVVGKPQEEKYYEEYKEVYLKILDDNYCKDLPIIYNVNIGHASPIGILPLGIEYEIDLDNKTIKFMESATSLVRKK